MVATSISIALGVLLEKVTGDLLWAFIWLVPMVATHFSEERDYRIHGKLPLWRRGRLRPMALAEVAALILPALCVVIIGVAIRSLTTR